MSALARLSDLRSAGSEALPAKQDSYLLYLKAPLPPGVKSVTRSWVCWVVGREGDLFRMIYYDYYIYFPSYERVFELLFGLLQAR